MSIAEYNFELLFLLYTKTKWKKIKKKTAKERISEIILSEPGRASTLNLAKLQHVNFANFVVFYTYIFLFCQQKIISLLPPSQCSSKLDHYPKIIQISKKSRKKERRDFESDCWDGIFFFSNTYNDVILYDCV